jgi:hypothetical protein
MGEKQQQRDYEAHNAKIALDLSRAQQRIEELEAVLSWVAEHAPGIEVSIARYAKETSDE